MKRALVVLAIVCLILALGWEAGLRPSRSRPSAHGPGDRRVAIIPETPRGAPAPAAASAEDRHHGPTASPETTLGSQIVGTLRGTDGSPTPGLVALLSGSHLSEPHRFADADDRGQFAFDVEPGDWRMRGEGADGISETRYLTVPEGEAIQVELELLAAATVRGIVRSHDGAPVQRARVTPVNGGFRRGVETDGRGQFELRLLPDNYPLRAEAPGHAPVQKDVEVRQDPETVCDFELGVPHRIHGRVLGNHGRPIAAAEVRARPDYMFAWVRAFDHVAISDEQGRYELVDLEDVEHTLTARVNGHLEVANEHVPVDREEVDFTLARDSGIAGKVVDLDRGSGVAGVLVCARPIRADNPAPTTRSGADGTFDIEGLGPGTWVVQARGAGYGLGESVGVDLQADSRLEGVLVRVERGGEIRGVALRASTREPIRRGQAWLLCGPGTEWPPSDRLPIVDPVHLGEDGGFCLKSVPAGRHRVYVEPIPRRTSAEATVDVEPGQTTRVELLVPDEGRLEGKVTRDGGALEEGIRVTILMESWAYRRATEISTDGRFEFEELVAGEYTLCVERDDHSWETLAYKQVRIGEGETLRCDIVISGGVRVAGVVRLNGVAAGPSWITFASVEAHKSGAVDALGRYDLTDVLPGRYRVHVRDAETTCEVPDGAGDIVRDFDFTSRGLRGRVLYPVGVEIPESARVSIRRVGPGAARGEPERVWPGSTSYSVSDLDPGEYALVATAKGCGSLISGPIVVPDDDRVLEHDLALPAPVEMEVLVVDPSGKGVPRAEVKVVDATWGLPVPVETKNGPSDHRGRLTIVGLGPGRYRLRAALPGWTSDETRVEVVGSSPPAATVKVTQDRR